MTSSDKGEQCPTLVRTYWTIGKALRPRDFDEFPRRVEQGNEVLLYVTPETTLRDIADMLQESIPEAREKDSRLGLSLVFPSRDPNHRSSKYTLSRIGIVPAVFSCPEDEMAKPLAAVRYQPGDLLCVCIMKRK